VISGRAARRPLRGDDRLELPRGPVDDPRVIERAGQHHDARPAEQRAGQLGLHPEPARRTGKLLPQPCAVVDQHVLLDRSGVRVIGQISLLAHQVDEVGQAAVIGGQVARRGIGGHLLAPQGFSCADATGLALSQPRRAFTTVPAAGRNGT